MSSELVPNCPPFSKLSQKEEIIHIQVLFR